ncbi:MAG: molybdopterin oxidoreductase family protein [Betaproteobacteria bacterium]|nr:molybdopterin oxidoreductase family protein [Betaproteobacteria bacterium]
MSPDSPNVHVDSERRAVRGACPHDCPDTCALVTTVENGVAIRIQGAAGHAPTNGVLCTKVAKYLDRTYSPDRLRYPQKRVGRKGEGRFERIGWDEALDTIAAKLKAIAADDPQAILPYSYAGTMGQVQGSSMDRRFFHKLGASLLDRTICSMAGKVGLSYTLGASLGMDMERFVDSKLILLWGTNPVTSSVHLWGRVVEARRRGAKVIAIDPYRSLSAAKCDQHIALLPGTDGALALGLMHVLIAEDLLDRDYIERYTLGFDGLATRVAEYAPERVAAICGIDAATIVALAREYGTIKPAAIRVNYGMQRTAGGGMAMRTIACLPALTGAWRDSAGGLLLSSGGTYPIARAALERTDLIPAGTRTINMSTIGDALTTMTEPPIKAIVVYNTNPVAVAPESEKVIAGFAREDLFTVVLEHFQTDTADYADILLPATTQLEHFDIHASYGHLYWMINNPAIAPLGEAKPNSEVFRQLAVRMGFDDPCFRDSDEALAQSALAAHPDNAGISVEALKEQGWQRLAVPESYAPFAQGNFPTPSGKCEFFSMRLQKLGFDPLPAYHPPRESAATAPALARRYPLAFISPPTRNFLNSSFGNVAVLQALETAQRVELHPDDAAARGIADGDAVRVHNDRGEFTATARITGNVRPGLCVALGIWWHKDTAGGRNINAVTSQALTDFGAGPTFYDCLVEVGKCDAAAVRQPSLHDETR